MPDREQSTCAGAEKHPLTNLENRGAFALTVPSQMCAIPAPHRRQPNCFDLNRHICKFIGPMEVAPVLLQFAAILFAVLCLSAFVRAMGLGRSPVLSDHEEAKDVVAAILGDFQPFEIALDSRGMGALAADDRGRIAILRQHGARFVGRIITDPAHATVFNKAGLDMLLVELDEVSFQRIEIVVNKPEYWAERINRK